MVGRRLNEWETCGTYIILLLQPEFAFGKKHLQFDAWLYILYTGRVSPPLSRLIWNAALNETFFRPVVSRPYSLEYLCDYSRRRYNSKFNVIIRVINTKLFNIIKLAFTCTVKSVHTIHAGSASLNEIYRLCVFKKNDFSSTCERIVYNDECLYRVRVNPSKLYRVKKYQTR